MTEKDGGSAGKGDVKDNTKGKAGDSAPPNKTAKISIDDALAENTMLRQQIAEKDKTIEALTTQLKAANDVLEAQQKSKLIGEIMPRSNFTIEDLTTKTVEELQEIRMTLDQAKLPTYKNIRSGPVGMDSPERDDGLTVGDLSITTKQRREQGRN